MLLDLPDTPSPCGQPVCPLARSPARAPHSGNDVPDAPRRAAGVSAAIRHGEVTGMASANPLLGGSRPWTS
jgi:hypothetical protein